MTYLKWILTLSLFVQSTAFAQVQRTIVNPSLELPPMSLSANLRVNELASGGWSTTHPVVNGNCTVGVANCRPLEFWSTGFNSTSAATGAGTQWVEINADTTSMIYQSVCMTNGESFDYSYLHRGRASATLADVMQFRIGIPTGLPAGSKAADSYSLPILQTATTSNGTVTAAPTGSGTINAPASAGNGWVRYSGRYTYTGTTRVVNIGFAAVSTGGGNLSIGNFIDAWSITLSPYIEATGANSSGPEGTVPGGGSNTPANGPAVRVLGTLASAATINVQVTGGTAAIGSDYSLSSTFQPGLLTNTAALTIPAGTYDGTSAASTFPIPFAMSADGITEPDETVIFTITGAAGAVLASHTGCGVAPIVTQTYTIIDDDAVTAGEVSISGRVMAEGRGLARTQLFLVDRQGQTIYRMTNQFGYFTFVGIPSGSSYILQAENKSFRFAPVLVAPADDIGGLLLAGERP